MTHEFDTQPKPTITYDGELKKLTVRGASAFPADVFEYADDLEILDIAQNQLTSLPDNLADLKKLRVAFFSGNTFSEIPDVFADCQGLELLGFKSCGLEQVGDAVLPRSLRGLILTDNNLTELPESIGDYASLQKLMLTGNNLTSLPSSLRRLGKLELLRASGNHLAEPAPWVAELPSMAWFSDSENDFNPATSLEAHHFQEFAWDELTFGPKLGESSKNVVYLATTSGGQQLAVKIFGQDITSDGSAMNDIVANLTAGSHQNLIGCLGTVTTPSEELGLVMPLVPREYTTLGLPPDFSDLTRDHYADGTVRTAPFVLKVAADISAALRHLHERGVMHGDVYAHNVLVTNDGTSKLGDFGAACLYDTASPNDDWRQQLDVTGYGHMLEELISLVDARESNDNSLDRLRRLSSECVNEIAAARPTFASICETLHVVNEQTPPN